MTSTHDRSIVVTGVGCVLPGGTGFNCFWDRLTAGDTALVPYGDSHIATRYTKYFGHVFAHDAAAAAEAIPFKLRRYAVPPAQWGVAAATAALAQSGLDLSHVPDDRRAIYVAQGDYMQPSIPLISRGLGAARSKNSLDIPSLTNEFLSNRGVDPFISIKCLANNVLAMSCLTFQMRGDCGAFVHDDTAVEGALHGAMFSLRHGYSDMVLLICAGSYNEALTLAELHQLEYLSPCADGAAALKPFDLRCDGTVLGEGAMALVLETAEHAGKRSARPLARIDGIASLVDLPHRKERTDTYRRCASQALSRAGIDLGEIGAIVAAGKGVYQRDLREADMLRQLLGDRNDTPITCPTPIVGLLPSCPVNWLAAIGILQHGQVPAIKNLEQPLDECLRLVRGSPIEHDTDHVLALNAGLSGNHSAVIFSNPRVEKRPK